MTDTASALPPLGTVRRAVILATRRLRQRRAVRFGATGFLAGSLVGFAVAVALNLNLLRETTLPGGGAFLFLPTLIGLVAGVFYGVVGKYEPVAVARLLEKRLDLKDRLSTALSPGHAGTPVHAAQATDAARHVPDDADVFRAVPLSPVPRRVYIAGAVALAVLLTYFAPELPVFWNPSRRAEQVAVKKEGARLLAVAKAAAQDAKKQNLPEAEAAAKKLEALGKEMTRGRMPLKDALIARSKLGEELRRVQEKLARAQGAKSDKQTKTNLSGTGRDLNQSLQKNGTAPGSDAPTGTPDARMKALQDALARGDKTAAANILRDMADAAERGEPTPGKERDKSAQQLAALGEALNKNNLPDAGRSAQNAGESLQKNNLPDAAQSLRDAADKIEQSGDKSASGENKPAQGGEQKPGDKQQSGDKQSGEQNALQKMADQVQKQTGQSQQSGQSGQQGSASQNGSQSGQQGSQQQNGQGSQQSGGQQGSQSGQQSQNAQNQQGQQTGQGQQSGGQGGQKGQGSKAGSQNGQGAQSGTKSGNKGAGGKGAGSDTSGTAKTGMSASRLAKGAREQNVHGKVRGTGPETIVTETDPDRSGLPVSSLPYYREFVKKRGAPAGESAQTGDAVPGAYKKEVRGYFDALPRKGAKGQP